MHFSPLFVSPRTKNNFRQEYRIYHDRLELATRCGVITVPFSDIEGVDVDGPVSIATPLNELRANHYRLALKLDWAQYQEHLTLETNSGPFRCILFTPDDLAEFKEALECALQQFHTLPMLEETPV